MFYDAHFYETSCIMDTCIMDTSAWVARPERPKGVKDKVKEALRLEVGARRAPKLLVLHIACSETQMTNALQLVLFKNLKAPSSAPLPRIAAVEEGSIISMA